MQKHDRRAVVAALLSALLFGASTPAAKLLVGEMSVFLLAGLLYAGSGAGLLFWLVIRRRNTGAASPPFARADIPWLVGAVISGGVIGPVLLMLGLVRTSASTVSLLLNMEGVMTALLAWFVFREHFDRRVAIGMALIVAAGLLLSLEPGSADAIDTGALAVLGASLAWAIDNNLTRRISAADAVTIAALKGGTAGAVNLTIGLLLGATLPAPGATLAAALTGLFGYGVSLVLFVVALRGLGAARTAAYFSVGPFAGAAVAMLALGETSSGMFWVAAVLMAAGVWLHISERHVHEHAHEPMLHSHRHVHDAHHQHAHDFAWDGSEPHEHLHDHGRLRHTHPHYPDIHHRHDHDAGSDRQSAQPARANGQAC